MTLKDKTNIDKHLKKILEGPLASKNWIASNSGVVEIDDSGHKTVMPSNCLLVQVAVQHNQGIHYDQRLFSKLTNMDKAGLIIHELAYYIARQYNHIINELGADNEKLLHKDSSKVRVFTARLTSREI